MNADDGEVPAWAWQRCPAVYRLYDNRRRLLYVGVTGSPRGRVRTHERTKPWFAEVDYLYFEFFHEYRDALTVEKHAINTENPIHNIARRVPYVEADV